MKPATHFPKMDGAPTLLRLAMLIDEAWPGTADERAEMAAAVGRHLHGDRAQAAADKLRQNVSEGLADLADGIQRTEAMVDGLKR